MDGPLISLADYELAARGALEPGAYAYLAGGAGDEVTLRDNAAAWRRLALLPRMLVGVGERKLEVTLLERSRPHPLLIAPMAFHSLAHAGAEIETARAAAATQTILCVPTLGTTGQAAVAQAVPAAPRWFQLYVFSDRAVSRELVAAAAEHGYEALVLTADVPVRSVRERELRTPVPEGAQLASKVTVGKTAGAVTPAHFAAQVDPDLRWEDVERLAAESRLPVVVKGLLTPEDARLAVDHGARAVVVSNHGGRQLDTVIASADALPAIVEEVGGQVDVLVDGGIRRGIDVLKALALGATAVMVGRPVLWGLAVGGAAGAQRVLEILLAEFDAALAMVGARRPSELDSRLLAPARWVAESQ
jgi:isopentenyl diphosphate isomerase/L-lactate dehydrogenase-like FMN-dependent dehydrogenase